MEKLEKELECSVCLRILSSPKVLPCQHTFCREPCMKELLNKETKKISSPLCRETQPMPEEGVDGLKTNFALQGILEAHSKILGKLSITVKLHTFQVRMTLVEISVNL